MSSTVSVIIPAYNPGSAIRKCLESLLSQSFSDIEIIIVNDGSTDDTDAICREFAVKDERIVYIRQKNSGVSSARNKGIVQAQGEYICFVDSDDYVDVDYVSAMIDAINTSDADIVIQGLKQMKDNRILDIEKFDNGIFPVSNLSDSQFDKVFYYCGPYCKLFKAAIIKREKISFPEDLSYGEDAVFYHTYLKKCKTIHLLSDATYNYMVANVGALSTKILPPDKFWQNQSHRRAAYKQLKKQYGLSGNISIKEQSCKLIGIAGMLNSIFKFCTDDKTVARYIELMNKDTDFGLNEIIAPTLKSKVTISLVKSNNKLSRMLLKKIYG